MAQSGCFAMALQSKPNSYCHKSILPLPLSPSLSLSLPLPPSLPPSLSPPLSLPLSLPPSPSLFQTFLCVVFMLSDIKSPVVAKQI